MNRRILIFQTIEDISDFINKAERYPYNMDVKCGRFVVDARSLMGLINIGVCRKMVLKVYEQNCEDFLRDIDKYITA